LVSVSVIVSAHNEEDFIGDCLDSLLSQDCEDFEIVVVEDGSTDRTREVVEAYLERSEKVRMLSSECKTSAGIARNWGVAESRGRIVAFTDADCLVHPQWLRCLQAAFQAPAVGGAAGDVQGMEPAKSWVQEVLNRRHHMSPIEQRRLSSGADQKLKLSFERPSQRLPRLLKRLGLVTYRHDSRLPLLPVAPTANIAYRREVFEQVGYFDETNHGAGDTEFAIRMQQQSNLKLVAVPEAVVYHSHRANLRQLWRAFARYEIGDVMLIETFLGLDNDVRRQLIVESIAYLIIGVPWLSVKLVFRALRSALIGPPYPLYIQDMIVNFVTLMSRHFTRIRAWNLLSQGRGGELWIP